MNMKHHPSEPETQTKLNNMSHSTTPSRFRPNSKTRHSPSPKQESVSPDVKTNGITTKTRRSLVLNRPKFSDDALGSQKLDEVKVLGRSVNRPVVEQFARPRRPRSTDACSGKNNEDGVVNGVKKELEEKVSLSENLVKDLRAEVVALKTELDKAQSLNAELEKQKNKLADDLVAAQAKIVALSSREQREPTGEYQSPKFKDIQKLIANKLEHSIVRKEVIKETSSIKPPPSGPKCSVPKAVDAETKAPTHPSMLAPPPPPPPPRPPARAAAPRKAPPLVQLYHSLTKQGGKKEQLELQNHNKPAVYSAHSSIVGEIQNRSAHLLAIKADIETKGDFIESLIQKVLAAAYTDIEDVLKFVDWLDAELSSLADEQAVLKHFKWPEKKADAMREAAVEYRELKLLESEISSYKDDINIPCGAALKKMASLLDKSERSIQRLIKLRNSVMRSYQDCNIPVDWMLDSGIVSKIKQASMKLAQMYMKRVTIEFESVRNSDRESTQEALLLQGVHFAYRAHQFAGGLDSETLCAFEEIRQRVPGHLGGSRQLLAGIPS
ncbi:hypothetical protein Pint_24164 [Pistacia integerrima]|uniref:Uncharacterized protein n=1 Tax=Pistacia integerrima TaxID=434235 RepID=A0ACC0Y9X2_9ROSI|nr:hypothetical protein Pint_24164 [Pistacia integerrima]